MRGCGGGRKLRRVFNIPPPPRKGDDVENINKVIITGNLTRDPELRATQGGTTILSLGVAVNDRRKDRDTGEWVDHANFVDCTMFGKRADSVSRYLHKGTHVTIEGKLRYESWEKNGERRSKLSVLVDNIEFQNKGESSERPTYETPVARSPQTSPQDAGLYDEEIPF
jgi:single-strand DNA-binding protein